MRIAFIYAGVIAFGVAVIWAASGAPKTRGGRHAYGGQALQLPVRFETETLLDHDMVFTCAHVNGRLGLECFLYRDADAESEAPQQPYFGNPRRENTL